MSPKVINKSYVRATLKLPNKLATETRQKIQHLIKKYTGDSKLVNYIFNALSLIQAMHYPGFLGIYGSFGSINNT